MTCSRWRRFPAARARSLTRFAAFLRRQASSSMVRAPTVTSKPPSNLMRTVLSLSEVPFASTRILVFGRRCVTFAAPAKDNDNKGGKSAIPCCDYQALRLVQHRQGQSVSTVIVGSVRNVSSPCCVLCSLLVDRNESQNTNKELRFPVFL